MIFDFFNQSSKKLLELLNNDDNEKRAAAILEFIKKDTRWLTNPLKGESLLHRLIKAGNIITLQAIFKYFSELPPKRQLDIKQRAAIFNIENRDGLLLAAIFGDEEVVKFFINKLGHHAINLANGNWTPLHYAAQFGYIEIVKVLIQTKWFGIDSIVESIEIATKNNYLEIVNLLEDALKNEDPNFKTYAENLNKIPTTKLRIEYLTEIETQVIHKTKQIQSKKTSQLTNRETQYINARKLWTDAVSEMNRINECYIKEEKIKEKTIQRLQNLCHLDERKAGQLYEDCLEYIRINSAICVSFSGGFLANGLTDFQLLNYFEKNNYFEGESDSYGKDRDAAEQGIFKLLPDELREQFLKNKHARPRYAQLVFLGKPYNGNRYGYSYLRLKRVANLNSLYFPGDSMYFKSQNNKDYQGCTWNNLGLLLWQASESALQAIVTGVQTGNFPSTFNQEIDYFEVMVGSLHIFNPDMVEEIHINSREVNLPQEIVDIIEERGINVTISNDIPYEKYKKELMAAIESNDIDAVKTLIKKYPSLVRTPNAQGELATQVAAKKGHLEVLKILEPHTHDFFWSFSHFKKIMHLFPSEKKHEIAQFFCENRIGKNKLEFAMLQYGIGIATEINDLNFIKEVMKWFSEKSQLSLKEITDKFIKLTPLQIAAQNGNLEIVKYFLEEIGVEINARHGYYNNDIEISFFGGGDTSKFDKANLLKQDASEQSHKFAPQSGISKTGD